MENDELKRKKEKTRKEILKEKEHWKEQGEKFLKSDHFQNSSLNHQRKD